MKEGENLYNISNISKKFESKTVFENISIMIPDKSIVSLIGKNGVGKTTLLNILAGISRMDGGDVNYNGLSIVDDYDKYMKQVTLINNSNFLFEFLTLEEHYEVVCSLCEDLDKEETKTLFLHLISIMEMEPYKDTIIRNLSLGTRQKVLIIISLITFPKIILFDEPFVNLDHSSVNALLIFLTNYIEDKAGIIIFSTHSSDQRLTKFTSHILEIEEDTKVTFKIQEKSN